jgi:type I restriction enzyme, S subunit
VIATAELPKGYKLTEAGVIPEDWDAQDLNGRVAILHGFGFKSEYFTDAGEFRLTTPGNFYESGGFRDLADKQKFYDGPVPNGYVLNEGELIVAMTEQADGLLGSAALVPLGDTYLHNQRLGKVKVLSPDICISFLYRVFNSPYYRTKVRGTAAGTKVKHTSPTKLLEIPVPLPPTKAEQEAIAGVLSDADALIGSLEQLLVKKRDIKQGAMQELLTGNKRLPGFNASWDIVHLRDLLSYERPDKYIVEDTEYVEYGIVPVLTANKSFILGYTNEEFGICFDTPVIVFDDFTTDCKYAAFPFKVKSSAIKLLRPRHERVNLRYVFERMQLVRFSLGDHKRYYISEYQHLELCMPAHDEQCAIVKILGDMDAEIGALEARLRKAREIKQGMMQQLLTGRIRLV